MTDLDTSAVHLQTITAQQAAYVKEHGTISIDGDMHVAGSLFLSGEEVTTSDIDPTLELTDGTHDLTGVTKITVTGATVGGTANAATLTITDTDAGTLELTDGTHDLTGVTKVTVTGATVGGTAGAATLTINDSDTVLAGGSAAPVVVSGSTQAFDASAANGMHMDILHDVTLSASGVTEGQLVSAAFDGDPSSDFTITFGTGFSATGTLAVTHATTATMLFRGHDGKLEELCRTTGLT